ncbi:Transforming growth factor-beta receptor-associated protein 1 [Yarrowia sp. C11]|nr:Transforming growth factor-beta receptor-associated protein 1 [Yarrowia sp. C11]KAG5364353.1 Transforming growth factor-beta receptor-associated protein 1 [Yarrowia sp. E02]
METPPYLKVQTLAPDVLEGATITCIEAWENSLYLGTSAGEVLHFFCVQDIQVSSTEKGRDIVPPQYIIASRQKVHATRTRAVDKIVVLPQISRALVLSNSTVSVFSVPEFAPASGFGKVRDVLDLCVDQNITTALLKNPLAATTSVHVTTFTKNTIRIINVSANGLKLVKDVSYAEALTGVRRGRLCLVGNAKTYDLVDVERVRKVPLFEVWSGADSGADLKPQPVTALVGDSEFLVACGTQKGDPAMGMIINSDGDISRGTIAWNDYPTSVVVDYPLVGAVVGQKVCFHNVVNQAEVLIGDGVERDDAKEEEKKEGKEESQEEEDSSDKKEDNKEENEDKKEEEDSGDKKDTDNKDTVSTSVTSSSATPEPSTPSSTTKVTISKVLKQFEIPFPEMIDKLSLVDVYSKDKKEESPNASNLAAWCKTSSNIFTYSGNGVFTYISTPRLFHLETLVEQQKLGELYTELESFGDGDSVNPEAAKCQKEYLQLLVCLSHLSHDRQADFKQIWTNSFHEYLLDLKILMYIFHPAILDKLEVPNGVVTALEVSKSLVAPGDGSGDAVARDWWQTCYDICRYHLRDSNTGDFQGRWMLEVFSCQLLVSKCASDLLKEGKSSDDSSDAVTDAIMHLVEHQLVTDKGISESAKILREHKKWYPLSLLDLRVNKIASVCEIWQSILAGDIDEPLFTNGPKRLSALLKTCSDKELVRAYGLWLVDKFPQEGVAIFVDQDSSNSGSKIKFNSKEDKDKISTAIKAMQNQVAWKSYLQQMLFVEGEVSMVGEYVGLLIDECISEIKDSKVDETSDLNSAYKALNPPKRSYFEYLKSNKGSDAVLTNRVDIIRMIDRGLCGKKREKEETTFKKDKKSGGVFGDTKWHFDVNWSASLTLEDYLSFQEKLIPYQNQFLMELVIIYGQLGDHQRCIDMLVHDLTDYQTAIDYCANVDTLEEGTAETLKRSLFAHLFKQLLKNTSGQETQVYYCRHVMEKYGNHLETKFVLNSVPSDWPIEILNGYLKNVLRQLTNDKNKSLMMKSLTRSENVSMTNQLTTLTRIDAEVRRE